MAIFANLRNFQFLNLQTLSPGHFWVHLRLLKKVSFNQFSFLEHSMGSILSCNEFFKKDSIKYIQSFKLPGTNVSYAKSRLIYADEEDLPTNCESIKKRSYFPIKPRTDFEAEFPIAFARIVYKVGT
jgi:hypothetical protein